MLCIKSIEVIDIKEDQIQIARQERSYDPWVMDADKPVAPLEVALELIRGDRFINADGQEFCIGMSKEVQIAIGLPFEAFDNMNRLLSEKDKELREFKDMSLWGKIKFILRHKITGSRED